MARSATKSGAATRRALFVLLVAVGCSGSVTATPQPAIATDVATHVPAPTHAAPTALTPAPTAPDVPSTATPTPLLTPTPRGSATPSETAGPTRSPDGWIDPLRISDRHYGDPVMVVDQDGFVHVAARLEDRIWHVSNRSGRWIREAVSDPPRQREDDSPSIAVDPADGSLWIAWARRASNLAPNFSEGAFYVTDRSGRWSQEELLVESAEHPIITVVNGVISVAYEDHEAPQADDLADYTRPLYGFTDSPPISGQPTVLSEIGLVLALEVGSSGILQTMFSAWGPGLSDDAHVFIFPDERVPGPSGPGYDMTGGFGPNGEAFVSWLPSDDENVVRLFTYRRDGAQWSDAEAGRPMAIDSGGTLHGLATEGPESSRRLSYWSLRDTEYESRDLFADSNFTDTALALDPDGRPSFFLSGPDGTWYASGPAR